jgi:hypothetical protein
VGGLIDLVRRKHDLVPDYASSWLDAVRKRSLLDGIETFCFFIGYPRSGHSLVGQLLNAHPNTVISHELNVLRYLKPGFAREQIYALILDRDRWFADRGREWTGYSYDVEGAWQGTWTDLEVIGDKEGAATSNWLAQDEDKLELLRERVEDPIRALHVTRNPFDNITTMARVGDISLASATRLYFRLADTCAWAREQMDEEEYLDVRHEDLIQHTARELSNMASFLGVEAPSEWLEPCAELVYDEPNRRREEVEWDEEVVEEIEQRLDRYPFLGDYGFEA